MVRIWSKIYYILRLILNIFYGGNDWKWPKTTEIMDENDWKWPKTTEIMDEMTENDWNVFLLLVMVTNNIG